MNNKEYAFKKENKIILKCWSCEKDFEDNVVYLNDGFCPGCKVEIDWQDEPYQPRLAELEKGND